MTRDGLEKEDWGFREGGYLPTNTTSVTVDSAETRAALPRITVSQQEIQTEAFYDNLKIIHHFPSHTMPP